MDILGVWLKPGKSECGNVSESLGLLGEFPPPGSGMLLRISLPVEKKVRRGLLASDISQDGRIQSKNLDGVIGKLSFTQTSGFGRYGRTMLKSHAWQVTRISLLRNTYAATYGFSQWWASSLMAHIPRTVELMRDKPDFAIYADAATSARILAAIVIPIPEFRDSRDSDAFF